MKKKLIIAGNGTVTDKLIERLLCDDRFELCGFMPDNVNNKFSDFYRNIKEANVSISQYSELDNISYDAIFALEYRRLIPAEVVKKHFFINCHAGILPKYRGFHANAWAIMNGEKHIGYSIHRMNEKMDDGLLYFVRKVSISYDQTYADVHDKMLNDIINTTPNVLFNIINGSEGGVSQDAKSGIIFGHKFTPELGIITNFEVDAEYIYNLYRCMARPLGSGIKIKYRGEIYDVNKVILGRNRNVCNYVGIPGRIVNIDSEGLWVKTLDNIIILGDIFNQDGESFDFEHKFKIGNSLTE